MDFDVSSSDVYQIEHVHIEAVFEDIPAHLRRSPRRLQTLVRHSLAVLTRSGDENPVHTLRAKLTAWLVSPERTQSEYPRGLETWLREGGYAEDPEVWDNAPGVPRGTPADAEQQALADRMRARRL